MSSATLSSKFQISISKEIRDEMGFKAGQKFAFLRTGRSLKLVPQPKIEELFGLGAGANTGDYRDRGERNGRLPNLARAEATGHLIGGACRHLRVDRMDRRHKLGQAFCQCAG